MGNQSQNEEISSNEYINEDEFMPTFSVRNEETVTIEKLEEMRQKFRIEIEEISKDCEKMDNEFFREFEEIISKYIYMRETHREQISPEKKNKSKEELLKEKNEETL